MVEVPVRDTQSQTNSAENNGPSGLHSGQKISECKNNTFVNIYCQEAQLSQIVPQDVLYELNLVNRYIAL